MESNCPLCLWDYCIERRVRINNLTAKNLFALMGETPYTTVYGIVGDISALADFAWYEPVYYLDHKQPFPYAKEVLGRYLGPSIGVGNEYLFLGFETEWKNHCSAYPSLLNTH